MRLTNNLDAEDVGSSLTAKSKWRPSGTIRVWDDNLSRQVPLQGVKVRARRWFTTHTGITNSSGYYSCGGRFRRDANYSINWERHDFLIRDRNLNGANYFGPKRRGSWNLDIRNGYQEHFATVFRGAMLYYYGNIRGLRRPPQNKTLRTQMKIRVYTTNSGDCGDVNAAGCHTSSWRAFGLSNPIKLALWFNIPQYYCHYDS